MKIARLVTLTAACGLIMAFVAPRAHALTCASGQKFASKVKTSPVVLIGQLVNVANKKYTVKVIKVLKGTAKKKTIIFDHGQPRMGGGFGFKTKKGQLILFFLQAGARDWLCSGPILIQ